MSQSWMKRGVVGLLVTAFGLFGAARAEAQGGNIDGRVRNSDGAPVVNAKVTLSGISEAATSNREGYYSFLKVPPNVYDVSVSAPPLQGARVTSLRVLDGQTVVTDFHLAPASGGFTTKAAADENESVMLRFQLITPTDGNAPVDPAIADVAASLKDLFRFPNYRLLDQSVMATDFSANNSKPGARTVRTQLTANGENLSLEISMDTVTKAGVRMSVRLMDMGPNARQIGELLNTTVSVSFDHTVVLGSTHLSVGGPAPARGNSLGALQQMVPSQAQPAAQGGQPQPGQRGQLQPGQRGQLQPGQAAPQASGQAQPRTPPLDPDYVKALPETRLSEMLPQGQAQQAGRGQPGMPAQLILVVRPVIRDN